MPGIHKFTAKQVATTQTAELVFFRYSVQELTHRVRKVHHPEAKRTINCLF